MIQDILGMVSDLTAAAGVDTHALKAIGIGLPGLVDRESGMALSYHPIQQWHDVPVRDLLEGAFGVPVFVDHNSNTMALGEACLGDATQYNHVVSVLMRTGVSIGVVQHREIHRQSPLGAGELGHTVINFRGPTCWCGTRGCLEAYASGWALSRKVKRLLRKMPSWEGRKAFTEPDGVFSPSVICHLARNGDPHANDLLRHMFHYLGIGVNTVVRLMSPDAVIINGSFNCAPELLTEEVKRVLNRPLKHPLAVPRIIVSSQDDRIGAAGAALMAASKYCNPLHRMPN